jgi:hypothetical protein
MRKAKKAKKPSRVVSKVRRARAFRVHKVRLAEAEVVRVTARKNVAPIVVHKKPGVIEIIPAPPEVVITGSWWRSWLK